MFTAELDAENAKRKTRSIASRLIKILGSIQQFSGVIGTLVSSHPAVAALLWGSVKLMLLVRSPYNVHLCALTNPVGQQQFCLLRQTVNLLG